MPAQRQRAMVFMFQRRLLFISLPAILSLIVSPALAYTTVECRRMGYNYACDWYAPTSACPCGYAPVRVFGSGALCCYSSSCELISTCNYHQCGSHPRCDFSYSARQCSTSCGTGFSYSVKTCPSATGGCAMGSTVVYYSSCNAGNPRSWTNWGSWSTCPTCGGTTRETRSCQGSCGSCSGSSVFSMYCVRLFYLMAS